MNILKAIYKIVHSLASQRGMWKSCGGQLRLFKTMNLEGKQGSSSLSTLPLPQTLLGYET